MDWTRRRFLGLAAGAAALATLRPRPTRAATGTPSRTIEALRALVTQRALASDDPDEPLPGAPDDAPPLAVAFEVT